MPEPAAQTWLSAPAPAIAAAIIRGGGGYILMGAIGKMLFGTPSDLPAALLRWMYWDHHALLVLVVALEAMVGVTALIAPRLAWPIVGAALVAFMVMLGVQMSEGAASCGCFGSAVAVPPWVMMIVDGALLALLAGARPWAALTAQPRRWWSVAVGAAAAIAAGAWVQQAASVDEQPEPAPIASNGAGSSSGGANNSGSTVPVIPNGAGDETPDPPAWRLPSKFPRYVVLQPDAWIGQPIAESVLATWVDPAEIPAEADVVFFMETCRHCAEHLRQLAEAPPSKPLVLIQVPTPAESTYPVVVTIYPESTRLRLPRGTTWHIRLPWHVEIGGGVVRSAKYLGQ